MASFPEDMNRWAAPLQGSLVVDGLTSATPLESLEQGGELAYSYQQLLVGIRPGCLGETCIIALLLGGLYLVVRRVISPLIPAVFVGTVFILTWLLGENPLVHIYLAARGAVFMATDYATSRKHRKAVLRRRGTRVNRVGSCPGILQS